MSFVSFFLLPPETYPSADGCEYTPRKYQPLLWYKIFSLVFFYTILIFLLFLFWCVLYIFIQAELVEIWQTD